MTDLTKRRLSIVIAVFVLLGGYMAMKAVSAQKEPPPKKERKQSIREVAVRNVELSSVDVDLSLQGRLVAFETVPVIAEVTGVFEGSDRAFKEGVFYKKGDMLARINNTEARYALLAQKSQLAKTLATVMPELKIDYASTFPAWDTYLRNFDPEKALAPLPEVTDASARYFLNGRDIYNLYYTIKSVEERLNKYVLRAPFSGTLTNVTATKGALIRSGQPLASLTASSYELAATVPVSDLSYLKTGTTAQLSGPNGEAYTGRVSRISTQIDPNTQTAKIFLSVRGKGLREGLFLTGSVAGSQLNDVTSIDQSLLVGTNEVYVLIGEELQRQSIEIVRRGQKNIYVKGLAPGTKLLNETLPGAYNGMKVKARKTEG
ncbi:MAG: efflux RND transporter periplasmic adaptor subunit [Saprospiraceae bacterium]